MVNRQNISIRIISLITLVSFIFAEISRADPDPCFSISNDKISAETLITKDDKADSFACSAALYIELAMAEAMRNKPLAGVEAFLARIRDIAASMKIEGATFVVSGGAAEGQVIVRIAAGYYLRYFNPKMSGLFLPEEGLQVVQQREINNYLTFQFLKSVPQEPAVKIFQPVVPASPEDAGRGTGNRPLEPDSKVVQPAAPPSLVGRHLAEKTPEDGTSDISLSDEDLRTVVSLASLSHGTNNPTEVFTKLVNVVSVREIVLLEDGYDDLPEEFKTALDEMDAAAGVFAELCRETVLALEKRDLDGDKISGWRKKANDAFDKYSQARKRYRLAHEGLSRGSVPAELSRMIKLLSDSLLDELLGMLEDRVNLMNGTLANENVDLRKVLGSFNDSIIIKPAKMTADTFKVKITNDPVFVRGNAISIISMICNIASNGAVYSYKEKKAAAVVNISLEREGDSAVIRIKDNGPGMSSQAKAKIRKPFNTTGGTGIGLTESFVTARIHGGRIDVISEPGQGTEFIIYLPIASPADPGRSLDGRPADEAGAGANGAPLQAPAADGQPLGLFSLAGFPGVYEIAEKLGIDPQIAAGLAVVSLLASVALGAYLSYLIYKVAKRKGSMPKVFSAAAGPLRLARKAAAAVWRPITYRLALKRLASTNPTVRARAVEQIARTGKADEKAAEAVVKALNDVDGRVVAASVDVIERVLPDIQKQPSLRTAASNELYRLMGPHSIVKRDKAIAALSRLVEGVSGDERQRAVQNFRTYLQDREDAVRRVAWGVLGSFGAHDPPTAAALIAMMNSSEPGQRRDAVTWMPAAAVDENARLTAGRRIAEMVADTDVSVAAAAVKALRGMEAHNIGSAMEELLALLSKNRRTSGMAAIAVAAMGSDIIVSGTMVHGQPLRVAFAAALVAKLTDSNEFIHDMAIRALKAIGFTSADLKRAYLKALSETDKPEGRVNAAQKLRGIAGLFPEGSSDWNEIVTALRNAQGDKDRSLAEAAGQSLRSMGAASLDQSADNLAGEQGVRAFRSSGRPRSGALEPPAMVQAAENRAGNEATVSAPVSMSAVIPELVNALVTAAYKKGKIVLAFDKDLGDTAIRNDLGEVIEALESLSQRNDALGRFLRNVVIKRGSGAVLARDIGSLVDRGSVQKENVIVITKTDNLQSFKAVDGLATITAVDDKSLTAEYLYPLVEIVLFTAARAAGYDREGIIRLYKSIPNCAELSDEDILAMCWDNAARAFNPTIVIKLIPGAVKAADKGIYREIIKTISAAA